MAPQTDITFDPNAFTVSVVAGVAQTYVVKLEPGHRLAAIAARLERVGTRD